MSTEQTPAMPCPICGPRGHDRHENDSYGSCTVCRQYVPHTDDEMELVTWPCATVQLAAERVENERLRAALEVVTPAPTLNVWRLDFTCYCPRSLREFCWGHPHRYVAPGEERGYIACQPHGHNARLAEADHD